VMMWGSAVYSHLRMAVVLMCPRRSSRSLEDVPRRLGVVALGTWILGMLYALARQHRDGSNMAAEIVNTVNCDTLHRNLVDLMMVEHYRELQYWLQTSTQPTARLKACQPANSSTRCGVFPEDIVINKKQH
jgi:hypothetical protein